ncbi:acyl-CoA dehydrogenase [Pandoraea terrae]|uniref:Acyl-CoA dehydrogenase n=1 Tax=Pandoraea terrae TaxID=1537710 RepID=A0A5E4ZCN2_9BURK|nr:acyl-CoA dehydrogenase family protein [Pandoraea terrae]VVE58427.1 acyl-CoA dehydrogenase [Pandoraea terrae]
MHLDYTPRQHALRAEAEAWLAEHVPQAPLASFDTAEGFAQHRAWERTLHGGRWSTLVWPQALGGRGSDLVDWLVFEEAYWRAGAPARVNQNGIFLLGPTLMAFGTPAQQARFLPPTAAGEFIWAQGWSEPESGSDIAAIRASAIRHGDHYVLNGQKIWSTRAVWADWLFGLFRSDPVASRHHGLSLMLVPLDSPGITVRPIRQLNGLTGFAEIFFDNVVVPIENRVGAEGAGWQVANATAAFERSLMLRSPARFQQTAAALRDLYAERHDGPCGDPAVEDAVLQAWMDAEAYTLSTYSTAGRLHKGGDLGDEASANKVFWSELDLRMHDTAMTLLGPHAECWPREGAGSASGAAPDHWLDGFLFAQAGPIYAGTNEIQRNIVAERLLGLPRG